MYDINRIIKNVSNFEKEAHQILSIHETSKSRVVLLEQTYNKLEKLSLKQEDLFRQSLRCAENGLFRASYVMSWAACIDFVEEIMVRDDLERIKNVRPKWKVNSIQDLREKFPESQILDAMKDAGYISKNENKAFHGLLNRRNECAHPSEYYPDLNSTLGYISEIFSRIESLQIKLKKIDEV